MTKSELQHRLCKLFLRLNGYVSSGLIIHSAIDHKNKTEIDLLAYRMPFHSQPDRDITDEPYLQIPENTIDIIIGEIKGGNVKNQFNKALRQDDDSLEKLVKWIGVLPANEIPALVSWLKTEMTPREVNVLLDFPKYLIADKYTVRPLIFNLDAIKPKSNQKRIIYGEIVLEFIWKCFRPPHKRNNCSVSYPLNMWGEELQPLVEYFKDPFKNSAGTMKDLYTYFKV